MTEPRVVRLLLIAADSAIRSLSFPVSWRVCTQWSA